MRILVAPDSFKGSLRSSEAAAVMAAGIGAALPDADIFTMPLADGGEGTLDVLQSVCGGEVRNDILYFSEHGIPCALIESAAFVGLTLPNMQGNLFERSSAALGKALIAGLDEGVRDIRIALGGSATLDGGLGLLAALGCRILDGAGEAVCHNLNGLMQVEKIEIDGMDRRWRETAMTVLSDVQNPLCGSQGAVYMYGPQKGLKVSRLPDAELAMQCWADMCEHSFAVSAMNDAGAGAAGGLGFALQLLGATSVSGAEYVLQACAFEQAASQADWVVTGEGCSDAQTLHGKLPLTVAQMAKQAGASVALISGDVQGKTLLAGYFDAIVSARPDELSVQETMAQAQNHLFAAAKNWAGSLR